MGDMNRNTHGNYYNTAKVIENMVTRLSIGDNDRDNKNRESSETPEEIDRQAQNEKNQPYKMPDSNNHPIEFFTNPENLTGVEVTNLLDTHRQIHNLLHKYSGKYFKNPITKLYPIRLNNFNNDNLNIPRQHIANLLASQAIAPHIQILGNSEPYISREGNNIPESAGHIARDYFEDNPNNKDSVFGDPEQISSLIPHLSSVGKSGSLMHDWITAMLYHLHNMHTGHIRNYDDRRVRGEVIPSNRPMPLSHYADTFWYWNKLPLWLQQHVRSGLHAIVDDPEKPFQKE